MRPKHVALWGAWYGSHNVGDQGMLITITNMLRDALGDVRFTVFTDNAAHVLDYGPKESGCDVRAFQNKRQFHRLVSTLATCDLFVIGGGVPFYEQPYHLWVMRTLVGLARLFRTPYMTWAVASQRIDSQKAKRTFKWVVDGACAVTYRDPLTGGMFESCGIKRELQWCADPVFRLEPERDELARAMIRRANGEEPARPLAALACRQMRCDHAYSQEHHNPKSPEVINTMIESFAVALDWMWESGYQPILLPMNTISPDDDRQIGRRIVAAAQHGAQAILVDEEIRPRVVPAIFRQCEFCMVSRLHAGVLAMVGNCPLLMYSIGPKTTGIMETMGLRRWVVEDETTSPKQVLQCLRELERDREQVRRAMRPRLGELREQATVPAAIAAKTLDPHLEQHVKSLRSTRAVA